MDEHRVRSSPRLTASIGGLLYLIVIFFGTFGEAFVRNRLVVGGDPAATAERLRTSELLWRFGIAGNLFHLACAVGVTLAVFVLLRPVDADLARLAAWFSLIAITIEAVAKERLGAALFPLADSAYLQALEPPQRHLLAYLSLRSHGYDFGISLIFFGCFCVLAGYLVFRSGYLPRALGVMMQVAGLCYLVNSFALVLSPPLANRLFPAILLPCFVAEASFAVWLLVKGVDVEKWEARAFA